MLLRSLRTPQPEKFGGKLGRSQENVCYA
ncbi:unnamed protein product [Callosobruchus maculatus]|uniref:Uncharacterized protein n=1 Tax=Callosobruchus maculatus TaxID=64391 RepID=A0A653BIU6_CALMS|nr:unnamed protein product [Callosobruchus maculatus]